MAQTPKYKEMTAASWQAAFVLLNSRVKDGVLEKGLLALTARHVCFPFLKLLWEDFGTKSIKKSKIKCCCWWHCFLLNFHSLRTIENKQVVFQSGLGQN
jgi:hypothetical protein